MLYKICGYDISLRKVIELLQLQARPIFQTVSSKVITSDCAKKILRRCQRTAFGISTAKSAMCINIQYSNILVVGNVIQKSQRCYNASIICKCGLFERLFLSLWIHFGGKHLVKDENQGFDEFVHVLRERSQSIYRYDPCVFCLKIEKTMITILYSLLPNY